MTYAGRRGREIGGVQGCGERGGERVIGNHGGGCLEQDRRGAQGEEKGGKKEG